MSRRRSLDAPTRAKFIELLRLGNYIETAARCVGVAKSTVHKWLQSGGVENRRRENGSKPDKELDWAVTFLRDCEEAQAQAEARDLETIRIASETQWQAAAWRLERKYGKRWGRQMTHALQPTKNGKVEVNITADSLSDDELAAIARGAQ